MKRTAFTLIELLVVVAVIAILAAIALPNFLEAMARSRVSRAKSDMRTVSLALESYRVDGNRYPPDSQFGVNAFVQRLASLTSPISYISSIPADPFANVGQIEEFIAASAAPLNGYTEGGNPSAPYLYPLTYDYAQRITPTGEFESVLTWVRITSTLGSTLWGMRSAGPDLWPDYLGNPAPAYDPTNGTVSSGNIYWTGPGTGEDQPLI